MMRVFGVGEVGGYIQQIMQVDEILADVWVTGEITSFTRASSGHLYFSLRDDIGQMRSVMWRSYAARIAAQPRAGDQVVAHGKVDFYPPQGSLQLVVDLLYPAGVGEAQLRFEALRLKLEEEGLFAEERKRLLPPFPKRIGLVTSETGAVYHDVVTVLSRRYPIAQLVFVHSSVQGERAPIEVVAGLKQLAAWRDTDGSPVDVVIVARGGGAPEELAVFNDERIARAVFAAPWPVISAVGHETDFTICDFVADHRAPTPSAAAEMVSPDLVALRLDVAELVERGRATVEQALETAEINVRRSRDRLLAHSPLTRIARDRQATLDQAARARLALDGWLRTLAEQLAGRRLQLAALSPRATLDRGYSIVTNESGAVVRTAAGVSAGDRLAIEVADGTVDATATGSRRDLAAKPRGDLTPPSPLSGAERGEQNGANSPLPRKGDDVGAADIRAAQRLGEGAPQDTARPHATSTKTGQQ